jgi:hypothetical protein
MKGVWWPALIRLADVRRIIMFQNPMRRIILFFMLVLPLLGQEVARRLILKDGSYQLVTKYEVKGDRVRYYSSEREEWEELPNSLVDWSATAKYEKDRASAPEAVQLDKELEHENEAAEAALPQVAPGLRIPEDQGVFLLDNFQGEPQLSEIQQNASDINRETKGNILRGAINPVAGMKQTIELEGSHAAVQAHVDVPSIYINVDTGPDTSQETRQQPSSSQGQPGPAERYHLLRVDVKGNKRILGDVKRQITGKVTQEQHMVKTTANPLAGGWTKLTPAQPLTPGEYAVVEMLGKEGMNLYVWDFGVNPKAPANANPWKPEKKTAVPASKPGNQ